MVMREPALSATGVRYLRRPVRIFGPCRSWRMQIGLFSAAATSRIVVISRAFSSWVPCEKFRRATSMPLRIRSRIMDAELLEGPRVQTILALRFVVTGGVTTGEAVIEFWDHFYPKSFR